jgi:hypothetical protein
MLWVVVSSGQAYLVGASGRSGNSRWAPGIRQDAILDAKEDNLHLRAGAGVRAMPGTVAPRQTTALCLQIPP